MKNQAADIFASGGKEARYSREERAMQFMAFDALEICRVEHRVTETVPENDEFPEMYRGPEFDIEIC